MSYWVSENLYSVFDNTPLGKISEIKQGLTTSNNERFIRYWSEVNFYNIGLNYTDSIKACESNLKWFPHNKGGSYRRWYGNLEYIVNYQNDGQEMKEFQNTLNQGWTARIKSREYYFHECLSWSMIASGVLGIRYYPHGTISNIAGPCIFDLSNIYYFLGLLNTKIVKLCLDVMNPTLNNNVLDFNKIPIIYKDSLQTKEHVKNNIAISKLDWDAHETSWDFQENELIRLVNKHRIETGVNNYPIEAVMMAYQAEWADKFKQLHANEEELNRQFIEIYGLQDELTPDVPLDEVTILQKGEIDIVDGKIVWNEGIIIKQFISYLVGCFMGRYSIDKPGLIIASQNQDLSALGVKVEGIDNGAQGRIEIDDDGVVPILAGEYFPDDMTVRIEQAIKLIFGEEHFQANLRYIDEKLGKPLREYLFKDFFNDHIDGKMYQKRPIYWMFSSKMGDKRKKGYFKALVYMHRMESDTLSKLHADYVVPYIDKIEQQHIEAEDLSLRDDISQAARNKARKSAEEYADQIRELKDFEQVLVQMASQRLSIDLDDGVRVNYPKFYPLVEPIKGLDKE